ncbi:hypothetical protein I5L42_31195, partial [Pseudomonas aeruginosa]|nr:hypothetical protein [Pseudomonas aeruginosa]
MNGISRLLSLALLGASLHAVAVQAEEQPRLFELLGQPGYKATWHAMFKGENEVPKWVSEASGPSSPSTSLSLDGGARARGGAGPPPRGGGPPPPGGGGGAAPGAPAGGG